MSEDREEILANFQGCTGIENVEEAIIWLENANWDLLTAIKNALPEETQDNTRQDQLQHLLDEKYLTKNGTSGAKSNDFLEIPSTSTTQRILEIHVHHHNDHYKLRVPEAMTIGCLKTIVSTDISIPPCEQLITGWPALPSSDNTTLAKLRVPNATHLFVSSTLEKNQVINMDIVEEPVDDWPSPQPAKEPEDDRREQCIKKPEIATEPQESSSSGRRRTRSGRSVKRLKRDNSKTLFALKIYDEVNHKEYSIKVPGSRTFGQLKNDAFGLTKIALENQIWCGWPGVVSELTKLGDLDLDQPFHCLILQSSLQNETNSPRVIAERIPSPIFIDLAADSDTSREEFEEATETYVVEDELFNDQEDSSRNRINPLIPEGVDNETAGSIHFIDGYALRYGTASPSFFPGPLEDAIKEACYRPARERRMLAIYLHHDGSVLSNVFCTELLGFETVLQTFANYFVVWGWDITFRGNRDMFLNSVTRLLGSTVADTVQGISPNLLPALMIISRTRSNTELLNVIYGNIGINELLTMLIHSVDVFTDMQETEAKEEKEREAREMIKVEQDKAYQESLQMDRAKEEAKKQELLRQSQEEERLKREKKEEEEKRQAERLAAESELVDEPAEGTPANQIITLRFRPPRGEPFVRKFLNSCSLKVVFNFLLVKGFRVKEYKLIAPWPARKDRAMKYLKHITNLCIGVMYMNYYCGPLLAQQGFGTKHSKKLVVFLSMMKIASCLNLACVFKKLLSWKSDK